MAYASTDPRFLHVGFHNFEVTTEIVDELEKLFNTAKDWARYAPNCWILWTSKSADDWAARIKAVPGIPENHGVLIFPINATHDSRGGSTYPWVWEWLDKQR